MWRWLSCGARRARHPGYFLDIPPRGWSRKNVLVMVMAVLSFALGTDGKKASLELRRNRLRTHRVASRLSMQAGKTV